MDIDERLRLMNLHSSDQRWAEAKERWRSGDLLKWFIHVGTASLANTREESAAGLRALSDADLVRMHSMASLAIGEVVERVDREEREERA